MRHTVEIASLLPAARRRMSIAPRLSLTDQAETAPFAASHPRDKETLV